MHILWKQCPQASEMMLVLSSVRQTEQEGISQRFYLLTSMQKYQLQKSNYNQIYLKTQYSLITVQVLTQSQSLLAYFLILDIQLISIFTLFLINMFDLMSCLQPKDYTYYQQFAINGTQMWLTLASLCFILYLLVTLIYPSSSHLHNHRKSKLIDTIKTISFNGGFICLTAIPLIWSSLDQLYLIEGMLGMMAISTVQIYLNNGRQLWQPNSILISQHSAVKSYVRLCLHLTIQSKRLLKIAAVCAIVLPCLFYKTCLCHYNIEVGYYNTDYGYGINTYVSRLFQIQQLCPPGAPCQMYATVPEDPAYAFFLNVHTHVEVESVTVFYQELYTKDPTVFKKVVADSFMHAGVEWKVARKVHSALIVNLQPDTQYLTKVFYNNQFWTNAIYRTLPDNNSRPIRMINAGDSGYTEPALNMSRIVSTLKPDIFFMGGDIAYDDNVPACAYTWDYFLGMYGRVTATLGYLMPIVVSVGNHDVGLDQLPGVNVTVNNFGPPFFIYFPQHYDRNLDGHIIKRVPPLKHRRSFVSYQFANVVYLVLDSGYVHNFHGYQKDFMVSELQNNHNKIKFINYHVPIYSSCEAIDLDPARYLHGLFHWVPVFDQFKVMTVYENHVHSFKRTKPMVGNTPKENGTVYVGDGAFGAPIYQLCQPQLTVDFFQSQSKSNNLWLSIIYADRVEHLAYDSFGTIIDSFTQSADTYKI